ncbi:MAG TPA: extensin family protein [Polyangiaceae bacterium]|nr:extensin family protein [Polyangiaceae bacterium]
MFLRSMTLAGLLLAGGCALHDPALRSPDPQTPLPPDYAWPPRAFAEGELPPAPSEQAKTAWSPAAPPQQAPSAWNTRAPAPLTPALNTGDCMAQLSASGVRYDALDATRGVVNPIKVTSDLGGIRYVPTGGLPLVVDCRFALTLMRLGPMLREIGVSALHYSGAYVYRMSSKGRLSLHANGLAIDIHEVTVDGEQLTIKKAFVKGLGDSCESNFPPLNRVACHLKRSGAFKEMLTPDYDANHHDHLHLAIAP